MAQELHQVRLSKDIWAQAAPASQSRSFLVWLIGVWGNATCTSAGSREIAPRREVGTKL